MANAPRHVPSIAYTWATSSVAQVSDILTPIHKKEGLYMSDRTACKAKKYRYDIIVIAAILIFSALLLLILTLIKKEGAVVSVEVNGQTVAEYSLDRNGIYSLNGGTNVLVIEEGKAYLNYSDCPDHVCENTGKIHFVGETIVCLPNRVTITVKGNSENGVDLVS